MVHSLTTGRHQRLDVGDSPVSMNTKAVTAAALPRISLPKYTPTGHLVFTKGSTIMVAPFRPDTLQVTGPVIPIAEEVNDFDVSLGGRIVYMTSQAYGGQLVWVDRHGSTEPILDQAQRFGRPRLSPNGGQLVVELIRGVRSDIAVYRFNSRTLTLLTTDGVSNSPEWHPDGLRIAFRAPDRVVWQSVDGTLPPGVLLAASDPAVRSASSLAAGVSRRTGRPSCSWSTLAPHERRHFFAVPWP